MVGGPPSIPPTGPATPQEPDPSQNKSSGKGFHAKPMTFLGMYFNSEQATKLWQVIIQSVNREINREKEKMVKSIRNFGSNKTDDD